MLFLVKKFVVAVIVLFNLLPSYSYALRWPSFIAPDKDFLMANNYIDTKSCPPGQGRLRSDAVIKMQPLCGSYCPSTWQWVTQSDNQCRDLATEFHFQGYDFYYHPDNNNNNNGTVLYSRVTAYYGLKDSDDPSFELTFRSPEEHWYCVRLSQNYLTVTCANDI